MVRGTRTKHAVAALIAAVLLLGVSGCQILGMQPDSHDQASEAPGEAPTPDSDAYTPSYTEPDSRFIQNQVVALCVSHANFDAETDGTNIEVREADATVLFSQDNGEYYVSFPNLAQPGTNVYCHSSDSRPYNFTDGWEKEHLVPAPKPTPLYTAPDVPFTEDEVIGWCVESAEQHLTVWTDHEAEYWGGGLQIQASDAQVSFGEMDGEYYIAFPNLAVPDRTVYCRTDGKRPDILFDERDIGSYYAFMYADGKP